MGERPLYIVLIGAPGAGKGTQAALLEEELGIPHISSGDMLREAVAKGTELGRLAKSYMDKGELVPDEVMIKLILERLSMADCQKGALLDGFPRTPEQAKALDEALAKEGKTIALVPYLKVSLDKLLERLSGRWICRNCQAVYHMVYNPPKDDKRCDICGGELYQREDDRPETARRRLEVYFAQTAPLIEYYRKAGLLREVDGERAIEEIHQELRSLIEKARESKQNDCP
jgi:adenylate kinase